ncbi:MAG: putative uridylyltransferase [Verrucomicrobia subdivision 3 bacterium]|nr:putative uridylyltransferase [Limisphaerales bacterium]MCS1413490.1 putative uridylyltransferase [Limisphaerales bacterium]
MTTERGTIVDAITQRSRKHRLPDASLRAFLNGVSKVQSGDSGLIREAEIEPVDSLLHASTFEADPAKAKELFRHLAVIKLNGGLGTGMGLNGPKSLLKVKGSMTFLDIIAKQVLSYRDHSNGVAPAFYLMNSFSTQEQSLAFLQEKYPRLADRRGRLDFLQGKVPKLMSDTLLPAEWPEDPDLEWCPPGHGDIYASLVSSGLLDELLEDGIRYLFVSNADNLAATLDGALLNHFANSGAGFMMEVVRHTASDKKGGHLAKRKADGRLILRELAQCPQDEREQFAAINRYSYFNTNNLWVHLEELQAVLNNQHNGLLRLPIIKNIKNLDPRNINSPKVLQIESAMGSAIECFPNAVAVEVPRSRFSPVKTTADMLNLWSDAHHLTDDYQIRLAESRAGRPPVVVLDPRYFKYEADLEKRFPSGVPSMLHCDRLEIWGNLIFSPSVECKGEVRFENRDSNSKKVAPSKYQNRTVVL